MKTKKLFIALFAMIALGACSEQDTNPVQAFNTTFDAQKNWQESTLTSAFFQNQRSVSHYSFAKRDIEASLENSDLQNFRFILGLKNDQLEITMVGVDAQGTNIASIISTAYYDSEIYHTAIQSLKNSSFVYPKSRLETPIIGSHLLTYDATYDYINKWNKALESQNIEEMITNSGIRYRYYSMEKEVVADMIASTSVENIALFLGLNTQNELTTVFLKKDRNDALILNSFEKDGGGGSYDFTHPCPDWCNPG